VLYIGTVDSGYDVNLGAYRLSAIDNFQLESLEPDPELYTPVL
jgi:hypothetical protein